MSLTNTTAQRPGSVTVIQWLAYLQGALMIFGGIMFLALRSNAELREDLSSTQITIVGLVAIIIGLITLWVATMYARGDRLALIFIACVAALHLGSSIAWLFWHPAHLIVGLLDIAIAVIIFYLAVLSPDTRDYFDRYGH